MCPGATYLPNDGYSLMFIEYRPGDVVCAPREAHQAPEGLGTSGRRAEELPLRATTPPWSLPDQNDVPVLLFLNPP